MEAFEWPVNDAVPVTIQEERSLEGFEALKKPWDALVERCGQVPFLRHGFLATWLRHFTARPTLRILLAWQGERLIGALPLLQENTSLCGVPVTQLTSPTNSHSCRFDFLAERPAELGPLFMDWLSSDPSWEVLRLQDVPEGGAAHSLFEWARQHEWPRGAWESQRSPFLPLPASVEAFDAQRRAKRRSEYRRRRRRLSEMGRLCFDETTEACPRRLALGLGLEASGWKGERGTAINQSAGTLGFYSDLATWAAGEARLALSLLFLEERAVAFDFGLADSTRCYSLKVAYDESLAPFSPGQLLTEDTVFSCIRRGLREFDFLGDENESKREWTSSARPHQWLYVFRGNAKGRMLCKTKFQLMPLAKKFLNKPESSR